LETAVKSAIEKGSRSAIFVGLIIRIIIYGAALYFSSRLGAIALLGAAIGILLPRLAMGVRQGILPLLAKLRGKAGPAHYEAAEKTKMFIKEPWWVTYRGGRKYLTHRRYTRVVRADTATDPVERKQR
jgi:hypothetical protein